MTSFRKNIACQVCHIAVESTTPTKKYCPSCAYATILYGKQIRSRAWRRTHPTEKKIIACGSCGTSIVKNSGPHIFCKKCSHLQDIEMQKRRHKRWRSAHPDRIKEMERIFRQKNPAYRHYYYVKNAEKIKQRVKQWSVENIDHRRRRDKNYYELNKSAIITRQTVRDAKRMRTDPVYRLRKCFSRLIQHSLRKRGESKRQMHWETVVGYRVSELKAHLEKQFEPGMAWQNYGKWHVDHIIPQSHFVFKSKDDPEFKRCWALDNLQPMWGKDNIAKGNRFLGKNRNDATEQILLGLKFGTPALVKLIEKSIRSGRAQEKESSVPHIAHDSQRTQ